MLLIYGVQFPLTACLSNSCKCDATTMAARCMRSSSFHAVLREECFNNPIDNPLAECCFRLRLAAMGGVPALGSFSMGESELLQHRRALTATASPAAQEVARLRNGAASPDTTPPVGAGAQTQGSPLWMVGISESIDACKLARFSLCLYRLYVTASMLYCCSVHLPVM